jgi:transcription initiation factor TFIIIB Brf1 subunit/transcription initiation factor TFIIB
VKYVVPKTGTQFTALLGVKTQEIGKAFSFLATEFSSIP